MRESTKRFIMKIGDYICINSGLEIYETVYSVVAGGYKDAAAAPAAAAAQASRGIGQVVDLDSTGVRIKWLKGDAWSWWYTINKIEQNFHVINNTPIIKTLYGT